MASQRSNRPGWDIPPLYFLLALLAMLALHVALPLARVVSWPWTLLGLLPIAAGAALTVLAARRFKRAGTAVRPFAPSSALVTGGPFRFSRNPMYLGLFLVLGGLFVLLGTLAPLFVLPAFILVIRNRFVLPEEAHMERHFGEAYLTYKRRVRRWI